LELLFSRRVLAITDGIDNGRDMHCWTGIMFFNTVYISMIIAAGAMRWELFGVLVLSWIFVYFIIWKGINQSGYVC
jgi:solute carrier family 6 GABA transporter-like protein 1